MSDLSPDWPCCRGIADHEGPRQSDALGCPVELDSLDR